MSPQREMPKESLTEPKRPRLPRRSKREFANSHCETDHEKSEVGGTRPDRTGPGHVAAIVS